MQGAQNLEFTFFANYSQEGVEAPSFARMRLAGNTLFLVIVQSLGSMGLLNFGTHSLGFGGRSDLSGIAT